MLASYIGFVMTAVRRGWAYMRRVDAAGIAGTAVAVAVCSQAVLMLFDPHLTYRGASDALFLILEGPNYPGGCGR